MTVKDLASKLQVFNPDAEVRLTSFLTFEDDCAPCSGVSRFNDRYIVLAPDLK